MPLWMILAQGAIAAFLAICVIGLVRQLMSARRQSKRGMRTTGTVLSFEERGESMADGMITVRLPTVEFTDLRGNRRTFHSSVPVDNCPEPGGSLPVWYDPDDDSVAPEVVDTHVGVSVAAYVGGIVVGVGLLFGFRLFAALWEG